jgi:hypothetical protein
MDTRNQRLLRIIGVVLALIVLLSGQSPFATALGTRQEPSPAPSIQGYGNFPRLPIVAPGVDGKALALYLVEGDQATQLTAFEELPAGHSSALVRLSPDGKHVALLLLDSRNGDSTLAVVGVEDGRRVALDRGAGDLTLGKGAAHEDITGLVWLDDTHLLYSKETKPSTEESEASDERGTPLPVRGEIWLADLQGGRRQLAAGSPVERVLGASPDGQRVYSVCYPEPERERHRGQGIRVLDVASGEMHVLWPSSERPLEGGSPFNEILTACTLVTMPDGTPRVAFATTEKHDGPREQPPDVWLADLESEKVEHVWAATQEDPALGQKWGHDLPLTFLWSPRSEQEFVYLGSGQTWGGVWQVDTETGQSRRLGDAGHLLAWTMEGIVVQTEDAVRLLDEDGQMQEEIRFSGAGTLAPQQVSSVVVDYDVPYVHQRWDTPTWWDTTARWGGDWSCGPASAVMALAYFNQLAEHTISVTKPRNVTHASDYGWYVPTDSCSYPYNNCTGYTYISACEGTNPFSNASPYKDPMSTNKAAGAHGACVAGTGKADQGMMQTYVQKHDVGSFYESSPTEAKVQGELDGGALVLLDTCLLGSDVGHFVVVRGYTDDSPTEYIVNDPWGDKSSGTYDTCENNADIHCGEGVQYSWDDLRGSCASPKWYVAVYGPEYLPYLRKSSGWESAITVQNGDKLTSAWTAKVEVCFMDSSGSFNTSEDNFDFPIPVNGIWTLPLSDVFSGDFYGSGVVVRHQTSVSTIARQQHSGELTIYNGIRGGGGSPGWQQVGSTLYAPVLKNDWYDRDSKIYVTNVGGITTTVYAYFYVHDTGTYRGHLTISDLAPNERYTVKSDAECSWGSGTQVCCPSSSYCSVRLVSTGAALAAVVREQTSDGSAPTTHNVFSAARTANYAPVVKNHYYGQVSGLAVMNTHSSLVAAVVTVTYYNVSSSDIYTSSMEIPRYTTRMFNNPPELPTDFLGSAVVSADRPIVTALYESGDGRYKATDAFLAGGEDLFMPELNTTSGYGSGISVQNGGGSEATIKVYYYNTDGTSAGTRGPYSISVGKTRILSAANGGVPSGFHGSAWIESTNGVPVVATLNYAGPGSGDVNATYNDSQP